MNVLRELEARVVEEGALRGEIVEADLDAHVQETRGEDCVEKEI